MKRFEIWFALLMFLVVVVFFLRSIQYDFFSNNGLIGKGFFPSIFCVCLLVLVGFYFSNVYSNHSKSKTDVDSENVLTKRILIRQLLFFVSLCLSVFLIDLLGTMFTLALFILGMLRYVEKVSWLKSFFISVGTTACLYLIFIHWLNSNLPKGIFF